MRIPALIFNYHMYRLVRITSQWYRNWTYPFSYQYCLKIFSLLEILLNISFEICVEMRFFFTKPKIHNTTSISRATTDKSPLKSSTSKTFQRKRIQGAFYKFFSAIGWIDGKRQYTQSTGMKTKNRFRSAYFGEAGGAILKSWALKPPADGTYRGTSRLRQGFLE